MSSPIALKSDSSVRVFLMICKNVVQTAIFRIMNNTLTKIKKFKKTKIFRIKECSNKYKHIEIHMIIQLALTGFSRIIMKTINFTLRPVFFDIKSEMQAIEKRLKTFNLAVQRFSRKQIGVYYYFHRLKRFTINEIYRNQLISTARKRAAATRLVFSLAKPVRVSFDRIKYNQKTWATKDIKVSFALFGFFVILEARLEQVKRGSMKRIRFVMKIKRISSSKKLKAKAYICVKNLNKAAVKRLRVYFEAWVRDWEKRFRKR